MDIQQFDPSCPIGTSSSYVSTTDGSIDFRVTFSKAQVTPAVMPRAQVDLAQLYAIDAPPPPLTFDEGLERILTAYEGETVEAGSGADFNNDGVVNKIDDLMALIELTIDETAAQQP